MRKNFLINKPFQIRFISFMVIVGLVTLISTYAILLDYFRELQGMATSSGLAENHPFRDLLRYQKDKLDIFFIYLAVINLTIITLSGVWMSHRIAGPIYRIVKNLRSPSFLKEGQRIISRKGDYFQELPEAINDFLKR